MLSAVAHDGLSATDPDRRQGLEQEICDKICKGHQETD
jgi:hypothetical protein